MWKLFHGMFDLCMVLPWGTIKRWIEKELGRDKEWLEKLFTCQQTFLLVSGVLRKDSVDSAVFSCIVHIVSPVQKTYGWERNVEREEAQECMCRGLFYNRFIFNGIWAWDELKDSFTQSALLPHLQFAVLVWTTRTLARILSPKSL